MKKKKLFFILVVFICIFIFIVLSLLFHNLENTIETSPIDLNGTVTVTQKNGLNYFDFYSIHGYRMHTIDESLQFNPNVIHYRVLYDFDESLSNFTIRSNEISYTEDLFNNYNILIFLTVSDYSLKLDKDGIQFQDDKEEYITLNLIENVHMNHYYSENSDSTYMQPEYYGGIILLPKQYILQEIEFHIKSADHSKQYICEKYHSLEFDPIFSQNILTPSLSKKHGFQEHDNRYLYKNNK